MTQLRAALIALVLLGTAIVAVGGALILSLQRWPPVAGTDHIDAGAGARLVVLGVWLAGVAVGTAAAGALWRPMLARTRHAAAALVALGAIGWTGLMAWALSIELGIYPTEPEWAAAAAPYATAARLLLLVAWLAGLVVAGWLLIQTSRGRAASQDD